MIYPANALPTIAPLFAWKSADGTRRYRRGYIEVPKKNGKSTLFSGLSLYLLTADGEPGAEVYSAAVDRDQASIVYTEAANMVEASPHLSYRLNVVRSTKRTVFPQIRSFYKALSADVSAQEGLNAHAILIDELHAQKNRQLWDTLRYAGSARRQPLHLSITTAGYDKHSICREQHAYASQVLDGTIKDSSFFTFIAAADDNDDWTTTSSSPSSNNIPAKIASSENVAAAPGTMTSCCKFLREQALSCRWPFMKAALAEPYLYRTTIGVAFQNQHAREQIEASRDQAADFQFLGSLGHYSTR